MPLQYTYEVHTEGTSEARDDYISSRPEEAVEEWWSRTGGYVTRSKKEVWLDLFNGRYGTDGKPFNRLPDAEGRIVEVRRCARRSTDS